MSLYRKKCGETVLKNKKRDTPLVIRVGNPNLVESKTAST